MTNKFFLLLVMIFSFCLGQTEAAGKVEWMTDYSEAVELSKANKKPVVLFFTGSDWCSWCVKLEKESLHTQEFANSAADKFIFVKLDYPRKSSVSEEVKKQNESLRVRYAIKGYPTIILIDSKENQIGTTGYRPGGGKEYSKYLIKMVDDYKPND